MNFNNMVQLHNAHYCHFPVTGVWCSYVLGSMPQWFGPRNFCCTEIYIPGTSVLGPTFFTTCWGGTTNSHTPTEKAIISPAAGLRAKSIISPAMFTYENPYLA